MGIFEKFKLGFKRSADKLSEGFREIVIKKEIDDRVTRLQNELNIAKEDIEFLKRKLNNNALWEQRLKETGRQVRRSLRDYIVPPKN